MAILFSPPRFKATDKSNAPISGAFLQFFQYQTSTLQPIYTDSTLQIPLLNPLKADANGLFPEIWLDDSLPPYKVIFASPDTNDPTLPGTVIWSIQQYNSTFSVDVLIPLLNPRTAAEISAGVIPTNYAYAPGIVDRYGTNTTPGTTDMSTAVRQALDSVPFTGGIIQFLPNATYLIGSVVYIPQRRNATTGVGGIIIEGNNCILTGTGLGSGSTGNGNFSSGAAMFETGTGVYSTVAKGGATNFGLGNELATTLHDHDVIRNVNFINFGLALHLFNFVLGCKLENLYFSTGYTAVSDARCFYSVWDNVCTSFQQSGAGSATYASFALADNINDRTFLGCRAIGAIPSGGASIGWQVSNGVQGCAWIGCSAEQCGTGFLNLGSILGATWAGGYFETNSVAAMNLGGVGAGNVVMNIDANDFISTAGNQPISITANSWVGGRLGRSNNFSGFDASNNTVVLTAASNAVTVEIPVQGFTESQSTATAIRIPAGYQLGGGVQIDGRRVVYVSSVGGQSELISERITNTGTPDFAYSGGPVQEAFETGYWLPFCTQTNTSGNSALLTQITWSTERMVVVFDLFGTITAGGSGTVQLSGIIFAGGAWVIRGDTNATYTVGGINNSGKLQVGISGSGMSGKTISWQGQIRHV